MDLQYWIGIGGAVAAWVGSIVIWCKSQAAQRTQNEFNKKEGLYRELLRTLTVFYKDGPPTGAAPFLEQYRLSWLYAPDEVVGILISLAESLKTDPEAEKQMTQEQQQRHRDERAKGGAQKIALLVAAIRKDLFETAGKKTKLVATDFHHYS